MKYKKVKKNYDNQKSEGNGDWEELNFYELLGLEQHQGEGGGQKEKENTTDGYDEEEGPLSRKGIRKAYHHESKLWHPDKRKSDDEMSREQINERFARIVQAYQVLSDPAKRKAYVRSCFGVMTMDNKRNNKHNGIITNTTKIHNLIASRTLPLHHGTTIRMHTMIK